MKKDDVLTKIDLMIASAEKEAEDYEGGMQNFLEDLQDSDEFYNEAFSDGKIEALKELRDAISKL